jgi:hypothetical protein
MMSLRTLKPGSWMHTIAVGLSSLAAAVCHPAQAKVSESKSSNNKTKKKESISLQRDDAAGDAAIAGPPLTATEQPLAGSSDVVRYQWKQNIVTTTFWIGEKPTKKNPVPNHISSWDAHWAKNYGGTDDPDPANRKDFIPTAFTPKQNPFYVALPYNDKVADGHKPEASLVIPWFKDTYEGPGKSVCKGRWIAIRNARTGKTCYAQWEDAGPFRTDHWQYVFGNERPKPNLNKGAGLDVSPAVRDFLGMNDTDVTDWKFAEFDEVPQGPWAKYGENNTFVINKRKADQRIAAAKTTKETAGALD